MAFRSTISKHLTSLARKQFHDGNKKLTLTNLGAYSFTDVLKAFIRQLKKNQFDGKGCKHFFQHCYGYTSYPCFPFYIDTLPAYFKAIY